MATDEARLLALVDNIFANCGLRVRIEGFDVLCDDKIYFEMCKILFPGDNIKLLKLSQSHASPSQKIQALLGYFQHHYGIDLSHISGEGIERGSVKHIRHMLEFFESISGELMREAGSAGIAGVKSARESVDAPQNDANNFPMHSVMGINREFRHEPVYSDENADDSENEEEDASDAGPNEKEDHRKKEQPGEDTGDLLPVVLKDEIINQIKEVKAQFKKINEIDNRKQRNHDLREIKNKYKGFLKDVIVGKRVDKNIEELREARKPQRNKTMTAYYAKKEQEQIEQEQQGVGIRLRDGKARYMRRIKQIVQKLERKRLADNRKEQLELERDFEEHTKLKLTSLSTKHARATEVLREQGHQQRQLFANRERQNIQLISDSHRQLKQQYRQERDKARSVYQQQQRRLFEVLQDDGALEQLIVDIYKRY